MLAMGTMKKGSTCCKCSKDIGKHFGIQSGNDDYCTDCWEKKRKEK